MQILINYLLWSCVAIYVLHKTNRMNLLAVTLFFPPLGIILAVRTPKPALEWLEIKESFFPED